MERADPVIEESRGLTGLRGVAALLVLLHHFYLHLRIDEHVPLLEPLLRRGYLGVDLFFVLSGFVMSMTYGSWFAGTRRPLLADYVRFLVRRIARLWPLHVAVLLVLVAFGLGSVGREITPRILVANVAMIQSWDLSATINPPAWSISTELLAYVLFPLFALLALRGRAGPLVAACCVVAAIAVCLHEAPPIGVSRRGTLDIYYNYSPLPALRCIAGFLTGMLAWNAGRLALVRRGASLAWAGPLGLAVLLAFMIGRVPDLVIFALLPAIVLGVHYGRGLGWWLLGHGPLYWLGVLSYAIYLIHYTLLMRYPFGTAPLREVFGIYVVLTLGLATAAHVLVERPGRRALRRLGDAILIRLFRPAARHEKPV